MGRRHEGVAYSGRGEEGNYEGILHARYLVVRWRGEACRRVYQPSQKM